MKPKNCLIFGGSGQVGSFLIRKLTKNGYKVTVVTRNIHQKGYKIKSLGNQGWIEIVEASIFDEKKIRKLFENTDICINLVGILFERKKGNTFNNIHTLFPSLLAKLSKEYNLKHFIHLSALGIDIASDSNYAISKLKGEKNIFNNFSLTTVLRPSLVYSINDNFTTNFMTLLRRLPVFPLYYNGETKFMPIHCSDLTEIIYNVIEKNIYSKIIECVGPDVISFKEILKILTKLIDKKRILLPIPFFLGNISAKFFELLPNPLLTQDQLRLLKYDNISSGKYKTNFNIGFPSKLKFENEVRKYCYMWKDGGQFSTDKYTKKDNDI
tara:strand:+ start:442 stop:1416 length:975 start_codon:yes stop_codon:yes gene_type:complete